VNQYRLMKWGLLRSAIGSREFKGPLAYNQRAFLSIELHYKIPQLPVSSCQGWHKSLLLSLATHLIHIHTLAFTLHILTLEKARIEFPKTPVEIKTQDLRITTTEYILDEKW